MGIFDRKADSKAAPAAGGATQASVSVGPGTSQPKAVGSIAYRVAGCWSYPYLRREELPAAERKARVPDFESVVSARIEGIDEELTNGSIVELNDLQAAVLGKNLILEVVRPS